MHGRVVVVGETTLVVVVEIEGMVVVAVLTVVEVFDVVVVDVVSTSRTTLVKDAKFSSPGVPTLLGPNCQGVETSPASRPRAAGGRPSGRPTPRSGW